MVNFNKVQFLTTNVIISLFILHGKSLFQKLLYVKKKLSSFCTITLFPSAIFIPNEGFLEAQNGLWKTKVMYRVNFIFNIFEKYQQYSNLK